MIQPTPLTVVFYSTVNGAAPVLEWLRQWIRTTAANSGWTCSGFRRTGLWHAAVPQSRRWEVRSSLRGGRIARLLFCLNAGEIFVLHGFIKKTRKTPAQDFELAKKRMKEVLK